MIAKVLTVAVFLACAAMACGIVHCTPPLAPWPARDVGRSHDRDAGPMSRGDDDGRELVR